jgi:hypothetical protein
LPPKPPIGGITWAASESLRHFGDCAPGRDIPDRNVDIRHADCRAHESDRAFLVDTVADFEGIRPGHVAARHDGEKAGVAGPHQPEESAQLLIEHIDHAKIAPAQRRAAIGMEIDRHAFGQMAWPACADAELRADRAAVAVGGNHVFGANGVSVAGQHIPDKAGDAAGVLLEGGQLGGVTHGRAELFGALVNKRLETLLSQEQPGRRADRGHAFIEVGDIGRDLLAGERFDRIDAAVRIELFLRRSPHPRLKPDRAKHF